MVLWWVTLIALVICLGLVGIIMVYGIKGALYSSDSTSIDPLPKDND